MNRKDFFRNISLLTGAAIVAPRLLKGEERSGKGTWEQIDEGNIHPHHHLQYPLTPDECFFVRTYSEESFTSYVHAFSGCVITSAHGVIDEIKDELRRRGSTDLDITLLCGDRVFISLENAMLDYIKAYRPCPDGCKGENRNIFMKNGITYHLYRIDNMDDWTMICTTNKSYG